MRPAQTQVLVEHGADGWWPMSWTRSGPGRTAAGESWSVTTEPASTYVLAIPADDCRVWDDPSTPGWSIKNFVRMARGSPEVQLRAWRRVLIQHLGRS